MVGVWARSASTRSLSCDGLHEFSDRPNMVSDTSGHSRGTTKGVMNAAEIVERKPYGIGGLQIRPLLAEGVCQPRQSPHSHPNGQVVALDVRGTNSFGVGVSPHGFNRCVHHLWWRVPVFFVGCGRIGFDKLAIINPCPKAGVDGVKVGLEAISRDLEVSRRGPFQFFGESHCVSGAAPSQVPSQDKFCVAFDSDKTVGIPACRIARDVALFLASHVTPNFVQFNISYGYIVDSAFQEPPAFLTDDNKQGKYRGVMKSREALDRADRASLDEKLNSLGSFIQRCVHAAKRCGMVFCKGLAALITAETLKTVAVFSKFLAAGIAVVTGHYEPCLSSAIGSQWSLKGSSEQSLGLGPAGCYKHPAGLLVNSLFLLIRQPAKSRHIIPTDIDDASVLTDIGSSLTNKSPHTSCPHSRESPDTFPQIRILSIRVDGFQIAFLPCNNGVNTDEQIFGRTSGNALFK